MSEQVRARQQVQELNQQLTRVNADLDSFVYIYLVARRHGELLVVIFTDTNDQPRSAMEHAGSEYSIIAFISTTKEIINQRKYTDET